MVSSLWRGEDRTPPPGFLSQPYRWRSVALLLTLVVVPILLVIGGAAPGRAADVEAGRRKAEPCAACHGADGNATLPLVPSLAGQPPFYTHWQLLLFRDQRRQDPQMSPFAATLSDADIADLAAYYATVKPKPRPAAGGDPETMSAGRRLAQAHRCDACHAAELPGPRYTPHLAGQPVRVPPQTVAGLQGPDPRRARRRHDDVGGPAPLRRGDRDACALLRGAPAGLTVHGPPGVLSSARCRSPCCSPSGSVT